MSAVQDGAGSTIVFTTSTVTGRVISISGLRQFRNTLDDTALADTVEKTCPATLQRSEPIEVTMIQDLAADTLPPFAVPETVTINFPKKINPAQSTASKLTSTSAYIISRTTPELVHDTELHITYTLQFDGAVYTKGS